MMRRRSCWWIFVGFIVLALGACTSNQPTIVIVVSATPNLPSNQITPELPTPEPSVPVVTAVPVQPDTSSGGTGSTPTLPLPPLPIASALPPTPTFEILPTLALSPVPDVPAIVPTSDPALTDPPEIPESHTVAAGDTLTGISVRYNVSMENILALNELLNPDILSIGQVIQLPQLPTEKTPNQKLIPDSLLVRGPGSGDFDVAEFVNQQPGFIRYAVDQVDIRQADGSVEQRTMNAAEIIEQVSMDYSVDPRLLLALLEYKANWLSELSIAVDAQTYPLISPRFSPGINRSGLFRQLSWLANELNRGYYGWKYRDFAVLDFGNDERYLYNSELNPASIALQHVLAFENVYPNWLNDVSYAGFNQVYHAYFGDPFLNMQDRVLPDGLQQPVLTLPFPDEETWLFTGGSHGGWGNGSAWSALDFAPPDEPQGDETLCYTSDNWVTAVADGVIARSDDGVVVLDLDGDGDETTGWTILYLHLGESGRVAEGTQVVEGDRLGRPACEGGFSTATHLHIARRYNGEWIPADCTDCLPRYQTPAFEMSGWRAVTLPGQVYQGFLDRGGVRLQAEQGRDTLINQIAR